MQTDHPAVLQTGRMFRHALAAEVAGKGFENPGSFRQGILDRRGGKKLLQRRFQDLTDPVLPGELRLISAGNYPNAGAGARQ